MNFKKDTTKVRSFGGGKITQTGFYPITIMKAYDHDGKDGPSKSVHLGFVTDCGKSGDVYICYQNKKAEPQESGVNRITGELMVLAELDDLKATAKMVPVYDFDIRQDVPTKKRVFTELEGKHIGAVFQMKEESAQELIDGKWVTSTSNLTRLTPNFICFASDTGQSAKEFLDGANAVSIDKYLSGLDPVKYLPMLYDAHIIKQANNQSNAPQVDPLPHPDKYVAAADDYDSDLPF